jgi:hypothetical protein
MSPRVVRSAPPSVSVVDVFERMSRNLPAAGPLVIRNNQGDAALARLENQPPPLCVTVFTVKASIQPARMPARRRARVVERQAEGCRHRTGQGEVFVAYGDGCTTVAPRLTSSRTKSRGKVNGNIVR